MRAVLTLAVLLALAAAAPVGAEKPAPRRTTTIPAEDNQGLGPLFGAAPEAVRARLGDPDVARAEGRGGFWTYRLPHCALFLFFHDTGRGLRVAGAATGPRKRGESVLTVEACLATAVQLSPP